MRLCSCSRSDFHPLTMPAHIKQASHIPTTNSSDTLIVGNEMVCNLYQTWHWFEESLEVGGLLDAGSHAACGYWPDNVLHKFESATTMAVQHHVGAPPVMKMPRPPSPGGRRTHRSSKGTSNRATKRSLTSSHVILLCCWFRFGRLSSMQSAMTSTTSEMNTWQDTGKHTAGQGYTLKHPRMLHVRANKSGTLHLLLYWGG